MILLSGSIGVLKLNEYVWYVDANIILKQFIVFVNSNNISRMIISLLYTINTIKSS